VVEGALGEEVEDTTTTIITTIIGFARRGKRYVTP
jgi:hypothetical protein